MNELTTNELVQQTKDLLNAVRGSLIRVAQNLHTLKENYEGDGFGKFAEDEFGLSQSAVSKYLTIHRVFILEGGAAPEQLEGVDMERLYLVRGIEGEVEEKIAKAKTLSRAELRREIQDDQPHEFSPKEICKTCGATRENHA